MEIERQQEGKTFRLKVAGDAGIAKIPALQASLLEILPEADLLTIDTGALTEIHVAFMQLLCSAHHTYAAAGKELRLQHPFPDILQQSVQEAGFVRHVGCKRDSRHTCLWCGGHSQ